MLPVVTIHDVATKRRPAFAAAELSAAETIVNDVRHNGEKALRVWCTKFGEIDDASPLLIDQPQLLQAYHAVDADTRQLLDRVAERIRHFAEAQKHTLNHANVVVQGGRAGHDWLPVNVAGCYAPGGRYPYPSTVLMTAITARVAGVRDVVVATPKPSAVMLAAAHVAGADAVLAAGGAQAVAAMAFGVVAPRADVICGPGNAYMTAAKYLVSAHCGIDMLAGPTDLLVVADETADPALIAADMLAQAEHDTAAQPMLIAFSEKLVMQVREALTQQLNHLATHAVAAEGMKNAFAMLARDDDEAAAWCDVIAPEHVQICLQHSWAFRAKIKNYGALFCGEHSAEVLGDYGMGPNHTLPTGGVARYAAGLSVFNFIKPRTWLLADDQNPGYAHLLRDSAHLARLEGLAGHEAAAAQRLKKL